MPRDYIRQAQPLLGRFRHGPDLANAGARIKEESALHLHLYSPQADLPDSICQPNPFLYEVRIIQGDKSEGAYDLGDGSEIVPSREARKLVAYLKSLNQEYKLPEMPILNSVKSDAPVVVPDNNATKDE